MSTPQSPGPSFEPHQYDPVPQQPAYGEPQQDPGGQLTPTPGQTPVAAQTPWYRQKRFNVPLAVVAFAVVLGIGGTLGRSTATPAIAPTPALADTPTSTPTAATFSLYQSCTYITTDVEGVIDFGYDDDADASTADGLATRLAQNVAQSPSPIHDDISLLITNLDKIQTTTMKVADFTEPAGRILSACDVDYTSPNDPLGDTTADTTADPTDEPSQEPAPKKESKFDQLSAEQQDAYGSAKDYLDSQAFSKAGLIDQLTSDYGDGYKKKDAKKAVDALDEDWYEQAVRAAKEYRDSQHFSTQGLIEQLDSDYGGQFTHDQAVYGVQHSR